MDDHLDELMALGPGGQCDGVDGACRDRQILVDEIIRLRARIAEAARQGIADVLSDDALSEADARAIVLIPKIVAFLQTCAEGTYSIATAKKLLAEIEGVR